MSVKSGSVYLKETSSGKIVEAEIRDAIEGAQLADWHTHWYPETQKRIAALARASAPPEAYPQSGHWNWPLKVSTMLLGNLGYCIVHNNRTEAMMRLDLASHRGRIASQRNLELVYIDFLETAPWNWTGPYYPPPLYRGCGAILLQAAIRTSLAENFKGRIGLHSLPQSTSYYAQCGFTAMGPDLNYPHSLPYFEATPEQAKAFLT